jgi:predicted dehydrogenase
VTESGVPTTRPIGIGVIGLGFMGSTHIGAYRAAGERCRLAGVFDLDRARLTGSAGGGGNIETDGNRDGRLFDPEEVFATDSLDALLARDDIHAVSVCTPTDSHIAVASAAIRAGKHVLVEKPVALERSAVRSLAEEAESAGVVCMPAMCMRFWPAWSWLRARVASDAPLRSLSLERIGTAPGWGAGFYQDDSRSGGALYDLHIHDTDFVCALLGTPAAVTSVGDTARITTVYHFADGPSHVVASGGWMRGGADFRMRYLAEFEGGTADFDLLRDPPLKRSNAADATEPEAVEVPPGDGYEGEVRAFLDAIAGGNSPPVTLADADATLAVLEAERRSLETGRREEVRAG